MQHFEELSANGDDGLNSPEVLTVDADPIESPTNAHDPVFGYLLPPPRSDRRYDAREVRGIGAKVAEWLADALASDAPLTVAATGAAEDAQRLYQLFHDYLSAHDRAVLTVDFSNGARALPRGEGKPLIYAGGGFGPGHTPAHRDGALVIAIAADEAEALEAEVRRLTIAAGRPVHVVPLGD